MFEKLKNISENLYIKLISRLALVMLLFSICRLLFFIYNFDLYNQVSLTDYIRMALGGLRFDLVAVLYTNVLFILLYIVPFKFRYNKQYQKIAEWIFIVTNSISLLVNLIDMVYFRFTLRRITFSVFNEFKNETGEFKFFGHFLWTYWYVAFLFILVIYVLKKFYGKQISTPSKFQKPLVYYPVGLLLLAIISGLFIAGVRGGFRHSTRPITLSNSGEYTKNPLEVNIVLNSTFTILQTIEITELPRANFFADENTLKNYYDPIKINTSKEPFKRMNVVVIILESHGKEYFGFYNHDIANSTYKGYTPFMDSLFSKSLTFKYSYANGQKSIDAMPSILCSIPFMVDPFITTKYSTNTINSIASLLKQKGYYSAYFHGAPNGSLGFQAFANLTGYDDYFGKTEYNNDNDFDNIWGIWDEEFFQFYATKMNSFKQPFLTTIFSVTSHDPFNIPERYQGKFPKGDLPIHQCIGYTDMSVRKFFKTASKMPWFKNTLFVFTADHTSLKSLEKYKTDLNHFAVPIVFYTPSQDLSQYNETDIIQQIDIMPSILGFLNYEKPYLAFGFDIFHRQREKYFAVNYKNGFYQLLSDKYLLRFEGKQTIGLFDFKNDEKLTTNLMVSNSLKADSMTQQVKAFIQQYNNRMLDNKLLP